jgi:hypothetical protein
MDEIEVAIQTTTAARERLRDDDEDEHVRLSFRLGELLQAAARQSDLLRDLERPSMVLMYENEERAAVQRSIRETPEGHVVVVPDAPAGLESKSREEIIHVLRSKQKCTWQQIVDFLVSNGVPTAKGGKWTTSGVYQMHKKGFRTTD